MTKIETVKCVFCKAEIEERQSHNAWPFPGDACTNCNTTRVLPARTTRSLWEHGKLPLEIMREMDKIERGDA